jgi:hypothetical protein
MVRQQDSQLRLKVGEGDTRRISLTLRDYGSRIGRDLSGYSSILFEWEDVRNVPQTPIPMSSSTAGASWSTGVIVFEIGPNDLTYAVGDYRFGVTLISSTKTQTVATGVVEVRDRVADSFTITP